MKRVMVKDKKIERKSHKEKIISDAKDRQVFNPLEKTLDLAKKRVTDLEENSRVHLPQPIDAKYES